MAGNQYKDDMMATTGSFGKDLGHAAYNATHKKDAARNARHGLDAARANFKAKTKKKKPTKKKKDGTITRAESMSEAEKVAKKIQFGRKK